MARYLTRWLTAVVEPDLEPATYAYYETMARLYVSPALGSVRLDRLQVRDVQAWLDQLPRVCQCCAQGKDAARPPAGSGAAPSARAATATPDAGRSRPPATPCAPRSTTPRPPTTWYPGTSPRSRRCPARAGAAAKAQRGPPRRRAGSWRRPTPAATRCSPPTSWSWPARSAKPRSSG